MRSHHPALIGEPMHLTLLVRGGALRRLTETDQRSPFSVNRVCFRNESRCLNQRRTRAIAKKVGRRTPVAAFLGFNVRSPNSRRRNATTHLTTCSPFCGSGIYFEAIQSMTTLLSP